MVEAAAAAAAQGAAGVSNALTSIAGLVQAGYGIYNAERNYSLEKENQAYNRDLQNRIFQREDTAVQRRVADLKAAGINPLLAAGQAANSGATVRSDAPQRQTPDLQGPILQALATFRAKADISNTVAQNAYIQAQTEKVNAEKYGIDQQNKILEQTVRINESTGLQKGSGQVSDTARAILGQLSELIYHFKTGR